MLEKQWTHMKVEHAQGSNTTYLYLANIWEVGHEFEVREGVVWQLGEGGSLFGVPTQTFLGEIFCWDDIPPKRGKHELESLGVCYMGW